MENYVLEQIKEIFEEMGLQYHCDGKGRIGVGLSDYCLMFHAAQDGLEFRLQMNLEIPVEYRIEMLEFLNNINCIIKEGHWELEEDGEVAFRIYTDLSLKSEVEEGRVLQVMKKAMNAADAFREGMIKISLGADAPKELFEEAIERLSI